MKKKVCLLIILLVVGFASVTASLIIKGNTSISVNEADYDIYFSEAILDDVDKTNVVIDDTRQIINFDTKKLTLVGEKSILEYEVTNNSKQYDAKVKINCMVKDQRILDYVNLSYYIDKEVIPARTKANGNITVELIKAFAEDEEFDNNLACEIVTNASERDSLVGDEVTSRIYYTYGFLVNSENEAIDNAVVSVFDREEARYTTTDGRGMFIIDNLSSGEYNLYAIENMSVEEVKTKTQEEMESLANYQTTFHTKGSTVTFENNYLKYGKVVAGNPTTHDITFDTNGGVVESFDSQVIEGQEVGFLPTIEHDSLVFKDWLNDGSELTEETIVDENTTILASYGEGVARIGDKNFRTLNKAFDYVTTDAPTTIEVIQDNSLSDSIETDKNIILDLNGKTVNFNNDFINNTGDLTIKNGNIVADGEYVLINSNNLNLIDNLDLQHVNNTNETVAIKTLTNNENSILNIDNASIITEFNSFVPTQSMLSNYGNANITSSNISSKDAVIFVYQGSNLNLNNSTVTFSNDFESGRIINIYGNFNFIDSEIKPLESNVTSNGNITVYKDGKANLLSGTIDNTYGKDNSIYSYEGSILTIGEENKEINFIGNGNNIYTLISKSNLNILNGIINISNSPYFIADFGIMTIGTKEITPTFNGNEGCRLFEIRGNKGSTIVNANINVLNNNAINIYANSKLAIENANIIQSNSTYTNRMIAVTGELIINDGTYKISDTNETGYGLIQLNSPGSVTIKSGTFDNTYGKANSIYTNEETTLNIGEENKELKIIGNGTNNYTIVSSGNLNILEGMINALNANAFIADYGTMLIGTAETIPTINGSEGCKLFDIRPNKGSTIVNANINELNNSVLYMYANSKLTIKNANIIQLNTTSASKTLGINGELNIENINITASGNSPGILRMYSGSKVNIDGGTYVLENGTKGNMINVAENSTLNIGENEKNPILIKLVNAGNYPPISNRGDINIYSGTIKTTSTNIIVQRYSSSQEEEQNIPLEDRLNYPATIKIFGGYLENNNETKPTISMTAGRLEMSGGEVVNKGTGTTINNSGGTAIQTGGTSLKNYGVTVQ